MIENYREEVLHMLLDLLKAVRMKRIFCSKIKMKKVLFLILLAALIQMVFFSMRDFMISISVSLAIRGNRYVSLGMVLTSKNIYLHKSFSK